MTLSDGADLEAMEKSFAALEPMDVAVAEGMLREAKRILDQLGVGFFLRQGTCLGAIRDNAIIPWDDDVDLGSVIGLHGATEESVDRVVAAFKDNGYFVRVDPSEHYIGVSMMKSTIRTDWTCYRIIGDSTFQYPGVRIPVRLLTQLKEIEFIGEKFLVPNPPEEYLRCKYGADWMTPKKTGYEKDILQMVPESPALGRAGRFKQSLTKLIGQRPAAKLRVLDHEGEPVVGAEVMVAGLGRFRTNKQGYAKLSLPRGDWYALIVRYDNHEEVLYEENMTPGAEYVYRADPLSADGRLYVLTQE